MMHFSSKIGYLMCSARLLEQLKQVILAKARICKWKITSLLMTFLSAVLWWSRRARQHIEADYQLH